MTLLSASMEIPQLLRDLAVVLAVAGVVSVVFQRLGQPVVLGYLLAGAMLGPYIPVPLYVRDEASLRELSELGVTLVVFGIGLEFSLSRLRGLGLGAVLLVVVEMGTQLLLGSAIGRAMGLDPRGGLFLGTLVAISSTMLVQRLVGQAGVDARLRALVLGLLVVEDLGAILLLALLSAFGSGAEAGWDELGSTSLRLVVFLASVIALGAWLVPPAAKAVLRLGRRETTTMAALGFCLVLALVASSAGFSPALGAFLAGSILAQADASHEVEARIEGVRDLFAGVFFVTVGMLVDPDQLQAHWGLVLGLAALVLVGKFVGVFIGALVAGADRPVAVRAALACGQIGELNFVVAGLGVAGGFLPAHYASTAVGACALCAFVAPLALQQADRVALALDRILPQRLDILTKVYASWLAELRGSGGRPRRYAVLQSALSPLVVTTALLSILLGAAGFLWDHGTPWIARATGLGSAGSAVVLLALVALPAGSLAWRTELHARRVAGLVADAILPRVAGRMDAAATPRRALGAMAHALLLLASALPVLVVSAHFLPALASPVVLALLFLVVALVAWRAATQLASHVRASAEVIAEALGLGLPPHELERQLQALLPGIGKLAVVCVPEEADCIGRDLAQLQLQSSTGAEVLACARAGKTRALPGDDLVLAAGDLLALGGSPDAVRAATRLVHSTSTPSMPK